MSEVQFWVAYDSVGESRVTINEAKRGEHYKCLECKGVMIPKKGDINRHHFAHKADFSCTGEGQRHLYIKELMYQMLVNNRTLIKESVGAIPTISMEKMYKGYQPDVLIKWGEDDFLAIEVCDTSPCSEEKIEAYGRENIAEIVITSWGEEEMNDAFFIANALYSELLQSIFKTRLNHLKSKIAAQEEELQNRITEGEKIIEQAKRDAQYHITEGELKVNAIHQERQETLMKMNEQIDSIKLAKEEEEKALKRVKDTIQFALQYIAYPEEMMKVEERAKCNIRRYKAECYNKKCKSILTLFDVSEVSRENLTGIHAKGGYVHFAWVNSKKRKMWVNYCPYCGATNWYKGWTE
jgi:hypothetical protein